MKVQKTYPIGEAYFNMRKPILSILKPKRKQVVLRTEKEVEDYITTAKLTDEERISICDCFYDQNEVKVWK